MFAMMRGVKKSEVRMLTSAMNGSFKVDPGPTFIHSRSLKDTSLGRIFQFKRPPHGTNQPMSQSAPNIPGSDVFCG